MPFHTPRGLQICPGSSATGLRNSVDGDSASRSRHTRYQALHLRGFTHAHCKHCQRDPRLLVEQLPHALRASRPRFDAAGCPGRSHQAEFTGPPLQNCSLAGARRLLHRRVVAVGILRTQSLRKATEQGTKGRWRIDCQLGRALARREQHPLRASTLVCQCKLPQEPDCAQRSED